MRRCEKESCCGIDIDIFLKKIKPLLKYNDQQINALPIKRDNDLDLIIIVEQVKPLLQSAILKVQIEQVDGPTLAAQL